VQLEFKTGAVLQLALSLKQQPKDLHTKKKKIDLARRFRESAVTNST